MTSHFVGQPILAAGRLLAGLFERDRISPPSRRDVLQTRGHRESGQPERLPAGRIAWRHQIGQQRIQPAIAIRITLLIALAGAAPAQTAPAFEVASVKVSAPLPNGVMMFRIGTPKQIDPGRIDYQGISLKALVASAYGVKEYQVEGPQWLDGERYDVIATIPKGADQEQVKLMTQALLAERFKLTLHRESKPLAVYTLSVGKDGAKLKEVEPSTLPATPPPGSAPPPPPPPPGGGNVPIGRGPMPAGPLRMQMGPYNRHLTGYFTIERLCGMLTNLTDRPVVDLTGLTGMYALDLSWSPSESENMGGKLPMLAGGPAGAASGPNASGQPQGPDSAGDPGMTLAQALQTNYGLKLEAKKNPVDILVIDHAEKVPTEN
jgi:uncharacterized protein (TIGR03435 family)